MADQANITLTGRMGREPELTHTQSSSVAKFSLAVNGFKKDETSWFNCEAWGKVGEIIMKFGSKGKQIAVSGTISIDNWTDSDGNKRQTPKVNVRELTLLGSKDDAQATAPKQSTEVSSDDLPF